MLKPVLALCALATVTIAAQSLPAAGAISGTTYATFAGVPFGSSLAAVKAAYVAKGYTDDGPGTEPNDEEFKGTIDDTSAVIYAFFDDKGGLMKTTVGLNTADDGLAAEYAHLHEIFRAKYGKPDKDYANFTPPYKSGDGKFVEALKAGDADFSAYWNQPGQSDNQVWIALLKAGLPIITYEGPTAAAYTKAHKPSTTKDL